MRHVIPEIEWPVHAPLIDAINRLKRQRNAVILAHNYQTPEIYHCVADIVGDSLALARQAVETDAEVIVLAGVHFMAETAKLLNPEKTVLIPDRGAGCSLAASITGADVRLLRQRYPGVPVVAYVNTSAEVKAETDVCCTSANAVEVVEALGVPQGDLPARRLPGQPRRRATPTSRSSPGTAIARCTSASPAPRSRPTARPIAGLTVIAHPECPPDVLDAADFVGSTAGMSAYVRDKRPGRVLMVTECSMSDNVAADYPEIEFVRPCNLCPHMKRITLDNIHNSLLTLAPRVEIDPGIAARARRSVERMLEIGRK